MDCTTTCKLSLITNGRLRNCRYTNVNQSGLVCIFIRTILCKLDNGYRHCKTIIIPLSLSIIFQVKTVYLPSFKVNLQRHTGQFNSSARFPSTKFSKHFLQNECRQDNVRGSSNVSRQIEHSSKLLRSCLWFAGGILLAEAMSNEGGVVYKEKSVQNNFQRADDLLLFNPPGANRKW